MNQFWDSIQNDGEFKFQVQQDSLISAAYKNQPTILIFDEVVSHLDDKRKKDLFSEITATNLQTFFSATNEDLIPVEFLGKMQVVRL